MTASRRLPAAPSLRWPRLSAAAVQGPDSIAGSRRAAPSTHPAVGRAPHPRAARRGERTRESARRPRPDPDRPRSSPDPDGRPES